MRSFGFVQGAMMAVGVLGLAVAVNAAPFTSGLINVDFNRGSSATATGAAVIGQNGDTWNGFKELTGSNLALVDSNNAATDVTLNYTATGQFSITGEASSTAKPDLLDDWVSVNHAQVGTMTIAGLDSNTTFDLYVYSQSDRDTRGVAISVQGEGTPLAGEIHNTYAGAAPSFILESNYLKFTLTPDASGQITFTFTAAPTGDPYQEGDINGFQIQAVPEPASFSILALGGLALLHRRRRHS